MDTIGYFANFANTVVTNNGRVILLSSIYSDQHGFYILKDSILRVSIVFTARRLIIGKYHTWLNDNDNYLVPLVEVEGDKMNDEQLKENYNRFKYDSLVYSLFNSSSQQSSLRAVTYKKQLWDIKNHFFWISRADILQAALLNNLEYTYKDAENDEDRYVYTSIYGADGIYSKLSPLAQEVLKAATELVFKSMSIRESFDSIEGNKKYQVLNWDSGYAQLKEIWKIHFKEEFKAFRKLYDDFADSLRPLVYELGFLRD